MYLELHIPPNFLTLLRCNFHLDCLLRLVIFRFLVYALNSTILAFDNSPDVSVELAELLNVISLFVFVVGVQVVELDGSLHTTDTHRLEFS